MNKGFSLVEVIVVIAILAVIGVITSTILSRSYRASSQGELLGKLKQNGDIAMKNIDETMLIPFRSLLPHRLLMVL